MSLMIDETKHTIKLLCDAVAPAGLHCDIAITATENTREECNQALYKAGWRVMGNHHICPTCWKRHCVSGTPIEWVRSVL